MQNVQDLRKIFSAQGIKGFGSANRATFLAAIEAAEIEAHAENEQYADSMEFAIAEREIEADNRALQAAPVTTEVKRRRNAFGRSRAGMVIVAKGTEFHKSLTFKAAAEAAGWHVEIEREWTGEVDEDGEPIERYRALATRSGSMVEGSWIGKAWDYAGSGAGIGGKARKVRNLKEALRILAGQA